MAGNIKGITVEIGGNTTKLGQALADVNGKTKSLQSELKGIDTLLKFDPGNTELLAQKQDVLKEAINETTEKLKTLKDVESQVVEQFNKGDIGAEQLRDFQREIIVTQNKLDGLENDLKSLESAADMSGAVSGFDKLTNEINDQESELSQLKDEYTNVVLEQGKSSKEAKVLREKLKSLNDELKDNQKKLDDAEEEASQYADALDKTGSAADDAEGGFTIMKGALADLTASAISGAVSAIGDFIGSLMELSEATEEYRTMQAKIEGSATNFGYSVEFANDKYKEFYGYLKDDQAATNAITNLMGLGTSTESVSALAEGASAVWTAYGDSIPIEGLTEAITETVLCGKVAGSLADTINWTKDANENLNGALSGNKEAQKAFNEAIKEGLPVEDAFNEALAKITDEQERADVVAKFLNDTYGESKKTYDELNSSVIEANEAELALKDTQAELGETLQPVNTAFTNLKNQALSAIQPLVEKLANSFLDLYNYLQENPTVMKIVTAAAIALAAAFGVLATALGIQALISGVTKAIAFLNTTLLANPITLIVAAIAALVAAFIYLWNNCEEFREFWINLWETIKNAFNVAVDWIKETAGKIGDFFVDAWNTISDAFSNVANWFKERFQAAWDGIKNTWNGVKQFFTDIWNGIKNIFEPVINWFKEKFEAAWNAIKTIWSAVAGFYSGVWKAICEIFKPVTDWFKQKFSDAWNAIKTAWSSVKQFFSDIWSNIKNTFNEVGNWFKEKFSTAWNNIKTAWNSVKTWFKDIWTNIKNTFTPVHTWFKEKFTAAWNNIKSAWSSVKTWFKDIWTNVKNTFTPVNTWFKDKFTSAWTSIKNAWSNVKSWFKDIWTNIKSTFSSVNTWFGDKFKSAKNAVVNAWSDIKSKFSTIWKNIKSAFTFNDMEDIGYNLIKGLWNGISNATTWLKNKISGFVGNVTSWLKKFFGIASPSKLMRDEIGKYLAEGIGVGIEDNEDKPLGALRKLGDDMMNQEFNVNSATLSRKLTTTFDTGNAGTALADSQLLAKLDGIYNRLNRLQIVLDTGTLVGETIDKIDIGLANKQLLNARGV